MIASRAPCRTGNSVDSRTHDVGAPIWEISRCVYLFDLGLQVAQLQRLLQPRVRVLRAELHLLLLLVEELQQLLDLRGQVGVLLARQLDPCTNTPACKSYLCEGFTSTSIFFSILWDSLTQNLTFENVPVT